MRTAVPGGATLIADSSYYSPNSHVSRKSKGQNSEKKGLKLRSRSASGINKNSSWLTRTFKKAFHSNFESDFETGKTAIKARVIILWTNNFFGPIYIRIFFMTYFH